MQWATHELSVLSQYGIDHRPDLFPHNPTLSLFPYLIVRTTDWITSVLKSGSEKDYVICGFQKILTMLI